MLHSTELTFIDISYLGEPFKQHICLKGVIKGNLNSNSYNKYYLNNLNNILDITELLVNLN